MTRFRSLLWETALRASILISLTLPSLLNAAELRQWTYTPPRGGDKVQFEAEFLEQKGDIVVLQDKAGRKAELPLAAFGAEDIRYVEKSKRTDGEGARVVRAHCFAVKDATGRERAVLDLQGGKGTEPQRTNPTLRLLTPNGQVRFEVGYSDMCEASMLHILRTDGSHGVTLLSGKNGNTVTFEQRGKRQPPIVLETWRDPNGRGEGGRIELFNPRGVPQVGLVVWPDDGSGMRLYDPDGRPYEPGNPPPVTVPSRRESNLALPSSGTPGPSIAAKPPAGPFPVIEAAAFQLVDEKSRVRAAFGHTQEGGNDRVGLLFFDVNGVVRTGLVYSQTGQVTKLGFCDERGRETLGASVSPDGNGFLLFTSNRDKSVGLSVVNPGEGRVGTIGMCLSGSDGRPRVIFGEHRGRGTLGAWDQSGDKVLLDIE